ncbi:hypothetical protein JW826_03325 [Candidatus Woesearchaeota archaeon]|nr:hypothetical protein [Candidatus Woesearchaeota archaeon]
MAERRSLFSGRRGFELQFNWLFVLIAGAIFLMFFFSIIRNQSDSSTEERASETQSDVDFLFRASLGSRSSDKLVPLGGSVEFMCEDGVSQYIVDGSRVSSQYNYLAVFSPSLLDGKELFVKTDFFRAPFHVMPFLFVTNKDTQYVFIGESPFLKSIYSSMPENATKRFLPPAEGVSQFKDGSFDKVIFVTDEKGYEDSFAGVKLSKFSNDRLKEVSLVVIAPLGGIANYYGAATFYRHSDSAFQRVDESFFFTPELALGAAYSGDLAIYSCQLDKALKRMGLIASIHEERIGKILEESRFSSACIDRYSSMNSYLEIMKELSDRKNLALDDYGELFEAIQGIKRVNTELIDKTPCPAIY